MNKKEQIDQLMQGITKNEKLKEAILGISNDQCLSEGIDDLEERNELFMFLCMSLALLAYSEIMALNDEKDYITPTEDEKKMLEQSKKVSENKILQDLIANIVKNEVNQNKSQVRYHLFLNTALNMLNNRNMISINESWNYKSPY